MIFKLDRPLELKAIAQNLDDFRDCAIDGRELLHRVLTMEDQEVVGTEGGVYGPSADPAEISELNKAAADELRAKAEMWRAIAGVCNALSAVVNGVLPLALADLKDRSK